MPRVPVAFLETFTLDRELILECGPAACVNLNRACDFWRAFPAVSYVTRSRGGKLEIAGVKVMRPPHDSLAVDDVILAAETR